MTWQGKALTSLTEMTSDKVTKSFAKGAKGNVHVFHNASSGIRVEGIWRAEYRILNGKNKLIYHNVFF